MTRPADDGTRTRSANTKTPGTQILWERCSVGRWAFASLILASCVTGALSAQSSGSTVSGVRALEDVRQLVAIGPRVAGTPGAERARQYIRSQVGRLGLKVDEQPFEGNTPLGPVKMVNLRVQLPGAAPSTGGRLVIAGHYDTKLFKEFAFVGANDGGSSAALLIELARVLKTRQNAMPIELLFLDGEEAVVQWQGDDHTYGSRYYVDAARKNGSLKDVRALILVDMIGDRDLRVKREANSTRWLTDAIWAAAKQLKKTQFVDEETPIEDDHIEFLDAGVQAVDIIDLEYSAWHTKDDTLDKVSAESLQVVGDVLLAALPAIEERLTRQ